MLLWSPLTQLSPPTPRKNSLKVLLWKFSQGVQIELLLCRRRSQVNYFFGSRVRNLTTTTTRQPWVNCPPIYCENRIPALVVALLQLIKLLKYDYHTTTNFAKLPRTTVEKFLTFWGGWWRQATLYQARIWEVFEEGTIFLDFCASEFCWWFFKGHLKSTRREPVIFQAEGAISPPVTRTLVNVSKRREGWRGNQEESNSFQNFISAFSNWEFHKTTNPWGKHVFVLEPPSLHTWCPPTIIHKMMERRLGGGAKNP